MKLRLLCSQYVASFPPFSVVWIILFLELVFEIMIRPNNYYQLIKSDKAFAPSTARYIGSFHLFFEFLALLTYIPEFGCAGNPDSCTRGALLSRVNASVLAILGPTHGDAAWGRLILGLSSLRFFGVIRHWKQMWINNTFHPTKREGIEKWLFPREKEYSESVRSRPIRNRLLSKKRDVSQNYNNCCFFLEAYHCIRIFRMMTQYTMMTPRR
jgi:hypothetical protein